MCALCGVLGGSDHWTDAVARPGVFTRAADPLERRRERARRITAANRILAHYQMKVADWQGTSFILSTATGKSEMVENLSHLWSVAERLSGHVCDPLDAGLLARMDAAHD
jgi:hypothetical protein